MSVATSLPKILFEGVNSIIYYRDTSEWNTPVIIKVIKNDFPTPTQLIQFNNEYEFTKDLKIEGIRKAYKKDKLEGKPALVLEYFQGVTFKKSFFENSWTYKDFLKVAINVAEALGQIHQNHIIHKDINSNNVLVDLATHRIKIIDFGISSRIDTRVQDLRNPDALEGTLAYISPEQTGRMNRAVDYRSDLYSLGVAFYEILTNKLPFTAADSIELVHCHLAQKPQPPHQVNPTVPRVLSEIVMKLLEKNAEDRYQSAFGLKNDLELCLKGFIANGNGKIDYFNLGQEDYSDRFSIPQKLYGREDEVKLLLNSFERVSNGATELVLVEGYSGVGKTSLVSETHRSITEKRGYFIKGKFDQYQKNVPYSAIIQALNEFIEYLLTENKDSLADWKRKINKVLGENGQILLDVLPNLEMIIGEQEHVQDLPPNEAKNRFNYVFKSFIRVISQKKHPIVLFIDDMQWADGASLNLLKVLMTDSENRYLLVIGAYRDNEVTSAHPLMIMVKSLQEQNAPISSIVLDNLGYEDIEKLITESLKAQILQVKQLSYLIYRKTHGNAFFATQFLESLYEEGLLHFDLQSKQWQWDIVKIEEKKTTDNVVELMTAKIEKLPVETQEILKFAACVGDKFDLQMLRSVSDFSLKDIFDRVWVAIEEGMILPLDDNYKRIAILSEDPALEQRLNARFKFLHDRVQQAVYSLIPDSRRFEMHYKVGKIIKENTPDGQLESKIFDIVNQLNVGVALLEDQQERYELARLNLIAGRKAKASAAYEPAYDYFYAGVALLDIIGWKDEYILALRLHNEAAEAAYLSGNGSGMEQFVNGVLTNANGFLDKVAVFDTKIQFLISKGKMNEAISLAVSTLKKLKVGFPRNVTKLHLLREIFRIKGMMTGKKVFDLANLPQMENKKKLAAMKILSGISLAAYVSGSPLYPMIIFRQVQLSIKYGNALVSTYAYSSYGIILCGVLGNLDSGYRFGELAIKLLDKHDSERFKARTYMVTNVMIRHWKEPLENSLKPLVKSYRKGIDTGFFEYAAFSIFMYIYYRFATGKELNEVEKEANMYIGAVYDLKQINPYHNLKLLRQTLLNYLGKADNPAVLEGEEYNLDLQKEIIEGGNKASICLHFFMKACLSYDFGEIEKAYSYIILTEKYLKGITATAGVPVYHMYDSLIHIAIYPSSSLWDRQRILRRIAKNQAKLYKFAKFSSSTNLHKYYLVEAELARAKNDYIETEKNFRLALEAVAKTNFIQEEALIKERFGYYWLQRKQEDIAMMFLRKAYYDYRIWGAKGKLEQMHEIYSHYVKQDAITEIGQTTTSPSHTLHTHNTNENAATTTMMTTSKISSSGSKSGTSFLDFETLIKSTQTLSQEVNFEELMPKMMRVVMENAGAEKAFLIQNYDGEFFIEAKGDLTQTQSTQFLHQSVEGDSNLVPRTIINYVVRTMQPLVLDNASEDEKYANDIYMKTYKPKSVLCFPVMRKNELLCLFYLENNLTTGAFTPDRLQTLQMLSTQVSISLENAQLYQNLEGKVKERTIELHEKNKRITDSIRYAQTIQDAILPAKKTLRELFTEHFVIYRPKDIVSGDFYWVTHVENYTFAAAVDCTGHGVPGAFMSMVGNTLLTDIVGVKRVFDPAKILEMLHEGVRAALHQKDSDNTDGMDVALCRIERQENWVEVTYAGAKRPLYYTSNGEIEKLKGDNLSIGGIVKKKEYVFTNQKAVLLAEDVIYLTSDGLIDQANPDKKKFGSTKFESLLKQFHERPFKEQKEILSNQLDQHQLDAEQRDDITVLALRL